MNTSSTKNTTRQGLLSLFMIVHLFFVFVALSANLAPSPLQSRLLQRFSFYTQLLNIDPNFARYYLTHATEEDVDHRVEIVSSTGGSPSEQVIRLPAEGFRGAENYKRQQRLARVLAFVAEEEALAGYLARAIGEHAVQQRNVTPEQVRVRRHLLQGREVIINGRPEERDPDSELYYRTPYAANCIVLDDGRVQVVRVEEAGQVARPADASNEKGP
jgi:hypothetical protein